ncbi:MAG: aminodeoxychorismate/anthranilate synthase component II [Candidatus Woesearchaeota archaeon]|nr:aminodeoxychorismate/anthranilate synthase component II [Candidatus Woesearchaeota archaeon]
MRVLFIDNFDSFTYNLVDEFKRQHCDVVIYRNTITMQELAGVCDSYQPDLIVLSPGPSAPKDAGICIDLIKKYHGKIPLFGVCLGHQCIIEALGGTVGNAPQPVHGKRSAITYTESTLFADMPNPFFAGRYHSLCGTTIPANTTITAHTNNIPMALQAESTYGVQFHPESILTTHGSQLITNLLGALQ